MILNLYNLKDASAAAIYGSRAANGVIVITKKTKGRESKF
jgi:TonB-dependent SusC/RagA subfamily outer membrane receptor